MDKMPSILPPEPEPRATRSSPRPTQRPTVKKSSIFSLEIAEEYATKIRRAIGAAVIIGIAAGGVYMAKEWHHLKGQTEEPSLEDKKAEHLRKLSQALKGKTFLVKWIMNQKHQEISAQVMVKEGSEDRLAVDIVAQSGPLEGAEFTPKSVERLSQEKDVKGRVMTKTLEADPSINLNGITITTHAILFGSNFSIDHPQATFTIEGANVIISHIQVTPSRSSLDGTPLPR